MKRASLFLLHLVMYMDEDVLIAFRENQLVITRACLHSQKMSSGMCRTRETVAILLILLLLLLLL